MHRFEHDFAAFSIGQGPPNHVPRQPPRAASPPLLLPLVQTPGPVQHGSDGPETHSSDPGPTIQHACRVHQLDGERGRYLLQLSAEPLRTKERGLHVVVTHVVVDHAFVAYLCVLAYFGNFDVFCLRSSTHGG